MLAFEAAIPPSTFNPRERHSPRSEESKLSLTDKSDWEPCHPMMMPRPRQGEPPSVSRASVRTSRRARPRAGKRPRVPVRQLPEPFPPSPAS